MRMPFWMCSDRVKKAAQLMAWQTQPDDVAEHLLIADVEAVGIFRDSADPL